MTKITCCANFAFRTWERKITQWEITRDYIEETLVTNVELVNRNLEIRIIANDLVDFHENIYLKNMTVENLSDEKREIRLFLCQDFSINGNRVGDTAAYMPEVAGLLHYKGARYFLVNVCANNKRKMCKYPKHHKFRVGRNIVVERNKVTGIKSTDHSIMLYALSTCVWCKKVKRLLGDLGLPYEYIDVDTLSGRDKNEVIEQVKAFNPMCSFPTMVVDGEKCIVGFKEEKIKEALQ